MSYENRRFPHIKRLSDIQTASPDAVELEKSLTQTPKRLPSCLSYTPDGSEFFSQLCEQPEYYPAHVERTLLKRDCENIIASVNPDQIVDLGCGSMEKVHIILHESIKRKNKVRFVPCDIDNKIIATGVSQLSYFYYNEVDFFPLQGFFEDCIESAPKSDGRCLYTFLGITYGNMTSDERASFLKTLLANMSDQDYFLLSADLIKNRQTMERAYQDHGGYVRRSMLESLVTLNRVYGADFDLGQFDHLARYEPERQAIVEYLVSRSNQIVSIPMLNLELRLAAGEGIETEFSEKFHFEQLLADLRDHGFCAAQTYVDVEMQYAMLLLRRETASSAKALREAA